MNQPHREALFRWSVGLLFALGIHVGIALSVMTWQRKAAPAPAAPVVRIQLAAPPAEPIQPLPHPQTEAVPPSPSESRPRPESKPTPKPEPKTESVAPPSPEPKPELEPVPEVESGVKPEAALPQSPPQSQPLQQPQPEPKPDPKPESKPKPEQHRPPPQEQTPPKPVSKPPAPPASASPAKPLPPAPQAVAPAPAPRATASRSTQAVQIWQQRLLAQIERHKRYPRAARRRRQEGVVYLYFVMDRQGRVLSARIRRSSGYALLDEETLALIRRASPLPAPPPGVGGKRIELVVPVEFFIR